ncbi:MAG: hypothetical protein RLO17_05350 [Cyclobacteriaceae bacterium]
MKKNLFICFLLISTLAFGQVEVEVEKDNDITGVHTWLHSIHPGEITWFDTDGDIQGEQYRVALTLSEIYFQMTIEKVTYGKEGCCKKITDMWDLDIFNAHLKYGTSPESPITFIKWINNKKYLIKIGETEFMVDFTEQPWTIAKYGGG